MADQAPTPLSDSEIARLRAESRTQKQSTGVSATPVQQTTPTVGDDYAQMKRDNIGSYTNTGINGYDRNTGQLSQTALDAQKANQAAYNQQAPSAEQFAQMNQQASTVGEQAQQGVKDQKVIGSYKQEPTIPLEFGTNVATPKIPTSTEATGKTADGQGTYQPSTGTFTGATGANPQDFVNSFIQNLDTRMDTFLNNTLSGYDSILNDIKQLTETQIEGATKFAQDMQSTLAKREEFYRAEYEAQKALTLQSSEMMMDIASQEKDNATKMNELAARSADADYTDRLSMAEENQARYLGFLTSKFDAMGMNDSSAGMRSIGKYLAAGEIAVNMVVRDKDSARAMYLAKGQEIATNYFKQAYSIEQSKQQSLLQLNNQFFEQSMKIMEAQITTEDTKNKQIMQASKEYNATRLQIANEAFNKIQAVTQQKFEEVKFQNQVIQEAIQNNQWEKQFGFSSDMAKKQFGLDLSRFDLEKDSTEFNQLLALQQEQRIADAQLTEQTGELYINGEKTGIRAMNGLSYDMQYDQYMTASTGEVYKNGRSTGVVTQNRREFESNYALNYAQFSSQEEERKFKMDLDKVSAGIASNAILAKYMDPQDVMLNGIKVKEKDGRVSTFGEKLAGAIETAANNVDKMFQCVQFVRKAIPDLPTGLFSLADKVRTLTQGDTSLDAPREGAVVVLDWKGKNDAGKSPDQYPGHVAIVTDVDEKARTFTITDYNGAGGGYKMGQRVISMDNSAVKGYWMSPSLQGIGATTGGATPTSVLPEKTQSKFDQIAGGLTSGARDYALERLKAYAQTGDEKAQENLLSGLALQNLPSATKNEVLAYDSTAKMADEFVNNLDADTPSGVYKQFENDTRKWADLEQDPKYAEMINKIAIIQAPLVNEIYGASITGDEFKRAKAWMINPDDKTADIIRKTKELSNFSKQKVKNALAASSGDLYSTSEPSQEVLDYLNNKLGNL